MSFFSSSVTFGVTIFSSFWLPFCLSPFAYSLLPTPFRCTVIFLHFSSFSSSLPLCRSRYCEKVCRWVSLGKPPFDPIYPPLKRTAICRKHVEFQSNPVCTGPIRNLPDHSQRSLLAVRLSFLWGGWCQILSAPKSQIAIAAIFPHYSSNRTTEQAKTRQVKPDHLSGHFSWVIPWTPPWDVS